jgi:transitional endoplasmic reticulum ATPase
MITLSPVQQRAYEELLAVLQPGVCATLVAGAGAGKSTILRAAHASLGGAWLDARDLVEAAEQVHPLALEDGFYRRVSAALNEHDAVFVDDFHLVGLVTAMGQLYPRHQWIFAALVALGNRVEREGKRLVMAGDHSPAMQGWRQARPVLLDAPAAADYEVVCRAYLPAAEADRLDFERVFRFARRLSARQLRRACESLPRNAAGGTDAFLEHLRARHLASNVDLGEVQAVELHDLKGMDDVIRALEANVILSLENAELAQEFGLKPKRGVLLAGPPGTGKTTVGRALAHRLRSKFFLIDGTVISGTGGFYNRITAIFEAARQNAPAVIFLDDSDVIFESGGELGLYRYLLTMLDGLESDSAGGICLMMTAMDVGSLPPALVRSGRIELWLETGPPDGGARVEILRDRCADLPASVGAVDVERLAAGTEGLTGADLKRLVEDGKILFAYDRAQGRPTDDATGYFLRAIETVRANKERYAAAEERARARHPSRPAIFDMLPMMSFDGAGFGADAGDVADFPFPPDMGE